MISSILFPQFFFFLFSGPEGKTSAGKSFHSNTSSLSLYLLKVPLWSNFYLFIFLGVSHRILYKKFSVYYFLSFLPFFTTCCFFFSVPEKEITNGEQSISHFQNWSSFFYSFSGYSVNYRWLTNNFPLVSFQRQSQGNHLLRVNYLFFSVIAIIFLFLMILSNIRLLKFISMTLLSLSFFVCLFAVLFRFPGSPKESSTVAGK